MITTLNIGSLKPNLPLIFSGKAPHEEIQPMQLPRSAPLASPQHLQLQFWGTRGSIPVSGAAHLRYGGNTSCVSLTSDTGHLFIFDCGSGLRNLGEFLASPQWTALPSQANGTQGYIMLSHTHWDHIQGFPFFTPVFRPDNRFHIMGGNDGSHNLAKVIAGQMDSHYFPVSFGTLPAELAFFAPPAAHLETELDGANLTTCLLKHTQPSLGYRLELSNKTIVYATDQEPLELPNLAADSILGDEVIDCNLVKLAQGADILIHDAQYSQTELAGKLGWGHSTAEIAVDTAIRAAVKRLVLFHHDPAHDDATIDAMLEAARQRAVALGNNKLEIVAASDGLLLNL